MSANSSGSLLLIVFIRLKLNSITTHLAQILTSNAYASEEDLFVKDTIRQVIVNRLIHTISCYKDCCEALLRTKRRPKQLTSAPNEGFLLVLFCSYFLLKSAALETSGQRADVDSRRLLVCVCNLDFVIQYSLPTVCRRFSDSGVKFADLILEVDKAAARIILSIKRKNI